MTPTQDPKPSEVQADEDEVLAPATPGAQALPTDTETDADD